MTISAPPQWQSCLSNLMSGADESGCGPDGDEQEVARKSPTCDTEVDWVSCQQNVIILEEPLKYKRENTAANSDELTNKRQKLSTTPTTSGTRKKHCEFNEVVKVVPIPMRTEYSTRVRQRLWSNTTEIQQNAARNTIEFASEGWDWRSVLLDESMFTCDKTGELVHPIHYEPLSFVGFDDARALTGTTLQVNAIPPDGSDIPTDEVPETNEVSSPLPPDTDPQTEAISLPPTATDLSE